METFSALLAICAGIHRSLAPSHYLCQCWLLISEALWYSPENNFTKSAQAKYCSVYWFWKLHIENLFLGNELTKLDITCMAEITGSITSIKHHTEHVLFILGPPGTWYDYQLTLITVWDKLDCWWKYIILTIIQTTHMDCQKTLQTRQNSMQIVWSLLLLPLTMNFLLLIWKHDLGPFSASCGE